MKGRGLFLFGVLLLAAGAAQGQISGNYLEFRTADVYTGPCFANAEVGLTGQEAVLAWQITSGAWSGVPLEGLAVVAVVKARATLGDPYANPLPANTVFIVDQHASEAQRTALMRFAQAQTAGLLNNVVAVEVAPIRFAMDEAGRHGYARLEAGDLVRLATRALTRADHFCTNEVVYYPPLASGLKHAMPVVAVEGSYRGNHLGMTWRENDRRGSFAGSFAY